MAANITPRVSIYSEGSDGNPGSSLYVLTGMITNAGDKTYTAPADATLDASTTYFVYFEDADSSTPRHKYTVSRASGSTLDTASQSGWTMGDRHQRRNAESWTTSSSQKLAIRLKGTVDTAPPECDALWCATLTVGQHPTLGVKTGFNTSYGALTPNEFTRNGSPITVDALFHEDPYLTVYYTGDLSGSGYTLELGSRSFDFPDPDGDGFLDVQTGRGWSVGDTVEVKLSEATVIASDDATLQSLIVDYLIDEIITNNAPIDPEFSRTRPRTQPEFPAESRLES